MECVNFLCHNHAYLLLVNHVSKVVSPLAQMGIHKWHDFIEFQFVLFVAIQHSPTMQALIDLPIDVKCLPNFIL